MKQLDLSNNLLKEKYKKLLIQNKLKYVKNNSKKILIISLFVFLIFLSIGFLYFNKYFKGITGFQIVGTRLVIITKVETLCNMNLEQGWNLISFPCLGEDTNLNLFFLNASYSNGSHEALLSYDVNDIIDPWKSYNSNLPNWTIQDLNLISRRKGYWLFSYNQTTLLINSSLATPTIINLEQGWNLIGYPSTINRPINETFDQLKPNFDYVYLYNASNKEWKEYTWNISKPSLQNLNYTVYNYGYWIYMLNQSSIIITS